MNSLDAGYRSLACAIIIRAVRDVRVHDRSDEARAFLTSPECKAMARLASIRWTVTDNDIDQAALRLGRRRRRVLPAKTRRHNHGNEPRARHDPGGGGPSRHHAALAV
ncbi:MAG: hypothetical protein WA040_21215 [Anaerolineae bacterium]|jgi:hypothetical protein